MMQKKIVRKTGKGKVWEKGEKERRGDDFQLSLVQ